MNTERAGNKALMWTILLVALIQMPHFAVMTAIEILTTEIFPERSLQAIQTAMSLSAMMSVVAGVASAMLIRYGLSSKKGMVAAGVILIAVTGAAAFVLNTQFWHLWLLNIVLGAGLGACIPNLQSIMFDNFDEKMRRFMSGTLSAFINAGGIITSLLGGILVTIVWYGGYLTTLLAIPAAAAVFIFIPRDKKMKSGGAEQRAKLPGGVYYHSALIFVFTIFKYGRDDESSDSPRGGEHRRRGDRRNSDLDYADGRGLLRSAVS